MSADKQRDERVASLLAEMEQLLSDWPTMRALTRLGADHATNNKLRARQIVAELKEVAA